MMFGLIVGALSLTAVSCVDNSFLDETQTSDLTKEVIFSDSTYTAGFLNHIYADADYDIFANRFGPGGLQSACDECEFKITSNVTDGVMFATGTVNPVTISVEPWKTCYRQIRSANVFLANVDGCPMNESRKTIYKAEARFLRAWYYAMLLRHYGGVPLMGDVVYDNSTVDDVNMKRATYAECVDYIVDECNDAAKSLPTVRTGSNMGRASAAACYALVARVKLYAASPLYNGTTVTSDQALRPLVGYTEANPERWKEAVEAAKRVMGLGVFNVYRRDKDQDGKDEVGWGYYAQYQAYDYSHLDAWDGETFNRGAYCGFIFLRHHPMGREREVLFNAASTGGNGNAGWPYLELVESYPMIDGRPINDSKYEYDQKQPDKNRDTRFQNSIVWNGSKIATGQGNTTTCYTYQGVGSTSDAIYQGTRTGFFIRKMTHRNTCPNSFIDVSQAWGMLRYEEVLLNYAEAVNEYYGPDHTETFGDEVIGPYEVLKKLRRRAGIEPGEHNMYGLDDGMDQNQMREAIRLERRIELAFEGHRFFDVRRWMIAPETENATLHGLEITRKLDGTYDYRTVAVRQHVFRPAMYFWPIPYDEVNRSEDLLQNPGY